jgi:hypothetical protein
MKTMSFALALLLAAAPAAADGPLLPAHPLYREECGSCHVPYPPRLLPAASWRELMSALERHFGTDASLEPAAHAGIERFLAANAGRRGASTPRITETRWFRKEHRGEISPTQNPANCAACHARAEDGYYDDD